MTVYLLVWLRQIDALRDQGQFQARRLYRVFIFVLVSVCYELQGEEVEYVAADDFEESDESDIEVSWWLDVAFSAVVYSTLRFGSVLTSLGSATALCQTGLLLRRLTVCRYTVLIINQAIHLNSAWPSLRG